MGSVGPAPSPRARRPAPPAWPGGARGSRGSRSQALECAPDLGVVGVLPPKDLVLLARAGKAARLAELCVLASHAIVVRLASQGFLVELHQDGAGDLLHRDRH